MESAPVFRSNLRATPRTADRKVLSPEFAAASAGGEKGHEQLLGHRGGCQGSFGLPRLARILPQLVQEPDGQQAVVHNSRSARHA